MADAMENAVKLLESKNGVNYGEIIRSLEKMSSDITTLTEKVNAFIVRLSQEESDTELVEAVVEDIEKDLDQYDDLQTEVTQRLRQARRLEEQAGNSVNGKRVAELKGFMEEYNSLKKRFTELDLDNKLGPINNG